MTDPVTGRPIVAELGRPETPQEKADRIAENRRKRRANQTARNLVLSLVASMAIVLFLVVVTVREEPDGLVIDYRASAIEAEGGLGQQVLAPEVPADWVSNRADLSGDSTVIEWYIGFITPGERFLALVQGFDANPSWLAEELRQPQSSEEIEIGGVTWTLYDRRGIEGVGNRQYALVTETETSTVVLYGTASEAEFAQLATAVAAELPEPAE
ncbi:DUF4245 domain-containing protein [Microcella daejeonensis]|uniref:DUF4245 domain-containing protein n=1 Tax=Microcella daejeonensis TaxID=2994971 RepID=A0A9E8MJ83_9MICO|nr:DUF4245 domain-containing protein [Microcella daejeonensis]WAB80578.1 DUF4245 domain-containing protein [Microcella daejeonensis]